MRVNGNDDKFTNSCFLFRLFTFLHAIHFKISFIFLIPINSINIALHRLLFFSSLFMSTNQKFLCYIYSIFSIKYAMHAKT